MMPFRFLGLVVPFTVLAEAYPFSFSEPGAAEKIEPLPECLSNAQFMKYLSEECVSACQDSCPALEEAVNAYIQGGRLEGTAKMQASMCGNEVAFQCLTDTRNYKKCKKFLKKAKRFGFVLPDSNAELESTCNATREAARVQHSQPGDETPKQTAEQAGEAADRSTNATYPCIGNKVLLEKLSPECLQACESSCPALDSALSGFLSGGAQELNQTMCTNQTAFECFVNASHKKDCGKFLKKARKWGFNLPRTSEQLTEQCSGAESCQKDHECHDEKKDKHGHHHHHHKKEHKHKDDDDKDKAKDDKKKDDDKDKDEDKKKDEDKAKSKDDDEDADDDDEKADDDDDDDDKAKVDDKAAKVDDKATTKDAPKVVENANTSFIQDSTCISNAQLMKHMDQKCIDACQSSCPALDGAISAYLKGGFEDGKYKMRESMCSNKESFACFVDSKNIASCTGMLEQAQRWGFDLPQSSRELAAKCEPASLAGVAKLDSRNIPRCINDEALLEHMSPGCIEACRPSCPSLDSAITAFLVGGDVRMEAHVCVDEKDFECFVDAKNSEQCSSFLQKAKEFGFDLPQTADQLSSKCAAGKDEADSLVKDEKVETEEDRINEARKCFTNAWLFKNISVDDMDRCMSGCQPSCNVLEKAMNASIDEGMPDGKNKMDAVLCENQTAFECFAKEASCAPVLETLQHLGFAVPQNATELQTTCSLEARADEEKEAQAALDDEDQKWPCISNAALLKDMDPDCHRACKNDCQSMERSLMAYISGGKDKMNEAMCASDMQCFAGTSQCATFMQTAKTYGFDLPQNLSEYNTRCREVQGDDWEDRKVETEEDRINEAGKCFTNAWLFKFISVDEMDRCLSGCQPACPALEKAMNASIDEGMPDGKSKMDAVVCAQQEAFQCFAQENSCTVVLETMQYLGFAVPQSVAELQKTCSPEARAAEEEEVHSRDPHEALPCISNAKLLKDMEPECQKACQRSCPEMERSLMAYITGGQDKLNSAMCSSVDDYDLKCFSSTAHCASFLKTAKEYGFDLPQNQKEYDTRCAKNKTTDQAATTEGVDEISDAFIEEGSPETAEDRIKEAGKCFTNAWLFKDIGVAEMERCLSGCQAACPALEKAMNAQLSEGLPNGRNELDAVVCGNQEAFQCFAEENSCAAVLETMQHLGFSVPQRVAELEKTCTPKAREAEEAAVHSRDPHAPLPCISNEALLKHLEPDCQQACQRSCPELERSLNAYLTGGKDKFSFAMCSSVEDYDLQCFVDATNAEKCSGFLKTAKQFGFDLPQTQEEYTAQCSTGKLAGEDDGSSDDSSADVKQVNSSNTTRNDTFVWKPTTEETNATETVREESDACGAYFKTCKAQCSQSSCAAMSEATAAYLKGGTQEAARSICGNREAYSCFVSPEHIGECSSMLLHSNQMGLPQSSADLDALCSGRRLRGSVRPSGDFLL